MVSNGTKWLDQPESKPAPTPLIAVQALVNTVDRESGADRFDEPAGALAWLRDHAVVASSVDVPRTDLTQIVAVREALRALLVHNGGGPRPDDESVRTLQELASAGSAALTVDHTGVVDVVAIGGPVQAYLAGLLVTVRDAQRDGTWGLLKACANDECQWAFYDRSRNHGGMWCDMAACGNKLKNRDFRARQRKSEAR